MASDEVSKYEWGYAGTRIYMGQPVSVGTTTPAGAPVAVPHIRVYEPVPIGPSTVEQVLQKSQDWKAHPPTKAEQEKVYVEAGVQWDTASKEWVSGVAVAPEEVPAPYPFESKWEKVIKPAEAVKAAEEFAERGVELPGVGAIYQRALPGDAREFMVIPQPFKSLEEYQKEQQLWERAEAEAEKPIWKVSHALSPEKLGGLITAGEIVETVGYGLVSPEQVRKTGKWKAEKTVGEAFQDLSDYWREQRVQRTYRYLKAPKKALRKEMVQTGYFAATGLAAPVVLSAVPAAGAWSIAKPIIGGGLTGIGGVEMFKAVPGLKEKKPGARTRAVLGGLTATGGMMYAATPIVEDWRARRRYKKIGLEPGEELYQPKWEEYRAKIQASMDERMGYMKYKGEVAGKDWQSKMAGKIKPIGEQMQEKIPLPDIKPKEFGFQTFVGAEKGKRGYFGTTFEFAERVGEKYYTFGVSDMYKIKSITPVPSGRWYSGYGAFPSTEIALERIPSFSWAESKLVGEPFVAREWEVKGQPYIELVSKFKTKGYAAYPRGYQPFRGLTTSWTTQKPSISATGGKGLQVKPPSLGGFWGTSMMGPPPHRFAGWQLPEYFPALTARAVTEQVSYIKPPVAKKEKLGFSLATVQSRMQKGFGAQRRARVQVQARSQMQTQKQMQKQMQKMSQSLKQMTGQVTEQVQIQKQIQTQKQVQKQIQAQRQITGQLLITPTITTTITPPPPPPGWFTMPKGWRAPSYKRVRKGKGRPRYRPSLGGLAAGKYIKAVPKERLTGLEVRFPVARKGRGLNLMKFAPFKPRKKPKKKRKRKRRKKKK